MMLVITGGSQFPFDRLLRSIDAGLWQERVVVQHGCSQVRPRTADCVEFLSVAELGRLIADARAVVSHAGVGSILLCLANGRRPIVVPRLRRYAETVDDHQLDCARRFARADLVTLIEDPAQLARAVAAAGHDLPPEASADRPLVDDLRRYLHEVTGPAAAR